MIKKEKQQFSFVRRLRSFRFAFAGILYLIRSQHNAWIHLVATIGVITAGVLLAVSPTEWGLLLLSIGFVWTAEAFNTALEALADRVSPETHPLTKVAKDVAAGAVLIAAVVSIIVGVIIFLPKLVP